MNVVTAHTGVINHVKTAFHGHCVLTASADKTAKMWDLRTLECVQTYESDTIVNDVVMSPCTDHVRFTILLSVCLCMFALIIHDGFFLFRCCLEADSRPEM